ncbi:glycosyltransferase [Stieleria sp. ICT_E10.1]|uniref:glycosyltransferase n=1 Tax=Stieleria sedimenti TaxID=2976331 RepID=UPI00218062E1|nr:glycosyltransferase [Stieleria sedimenti]MCS7466759.1 glycosyltransferase [Stieleria sedimenti]
MDLANMFYLPGIAKSYDSLWMERCVETWLCGLEQSILDDAVLDAHFGYPEGVGCWRVAKRRGIPVFITIRGLEVELFSTRSRGRQLVKALSEATGVIAVSHSLRNAAILAGVPKGKISVIPNGVDTACFHPGNKESARTAVGYRNTNKLIVSVGNLKPVKGHDTLIRAFASLENRTRVQLVCIGGGVTSPWGIELRKQADSLGIGNRVQFIGPQSPAVVADWLRAADLFALASRREGCCNAVLEALATGVQVVATDAGDNAFFVKTPCCGRVVPVEDWKAMGVAVDECLESNFDLCSITESVRDCSWSRVAESVVRTFESRAVPTALRIG